jgi:hypothetical protein
VDFEGSFEIPPTAMNVLGLFSAQISPEDGEDVVYLTWTSSPVS